MAYLGLWRFDLSVEGIESLFAKVLRNFEVQEHALHGFGFNRWFCSAEAFVDNRRVDLVLYRC